VAVALLAILGITGLAQAQQKNWKDQAEYDIFMSITKEADPAKKLALLQTWKEKYPESEYKVERLITTIPTYQQLRQADKMYETAQELQKLDPANPNALFYLASLPPSMNNTSPERLAAAERDANALIGALPTIFAKKPDNVTQEAFDAQRKAFLSTANGTLVWAASSRKDYKKVEELLTAQLKADPANGQTSYSLGSAILSQKDATRQAAALFHIARAAYYDGPNALTPDVKRQVQGFFEKTWVGFVGTRSGMQEFIDKTKASPFPEPDLVIKSKAQLEAEEEKKLQEENPQLFLWVRVRNALTNDPAYFEQLKGVGLPKLKGKIVSAMPATKTKEIVVALSGENPEIKLVISDMPFGQAAPVGTEIEFETAVPSAFTADPFLLTADIDRAQITGWPAELVGAPAAKKATSKKAVGKKK
jgi:hypothetical protein